MLGKTPRGCRDVVVSLRRTPKYEAMKKNKNSPVNSTSATVSRLMSDS